MLRGSGFVAVSAILLASFVTASVPANSFGGPRGVNRGGGFQGFNPEGFQGFNPGGFQGFNPGRAGRPFKSEFSEHGRFFPRQRFQRSFVWAGGYLVGGYGAPFSYDSTYYDPTLGDPLPTALPPTIRPGSTLRPPMVQSWFLGRSPSRLLLRASPLSIREDGTSFVATV